MDMGSSSFPRQWSVLAQLPREGGHHPRGVHSHGDVTLGDVGSGHGGGSGGSLRGLLQPEWFWNSVFMARGMPANSTVLSARRRVLCKQ